jgi:hypothetical protein
MTRSTRIIGSTALALLLLGAWFPVSAQSEAYGFQGTNKETPFIEVIGEAEVMVAPDGAVLTVGIELKNEAMSELMKSTDLCTKKVLAVVKAGGIQAKDIRTEYINLTTETNWKNVTTFSRTQERTQVTTYIQRSIIVLTVRDLSSLDKLYREIALCDGAQIKQLDFQTSELRKYRDEARIKAIQFAREKAELIAGQLGQKIGKARMIRELRNYFWSSYNTWWNRAPGGASQMVTYADRSNTSTDGPLFPGNISVKTELIVDFELN